MDDPAYRLLQAWMLACHVDPDAAQMISEQFLSGRISPEQAIAAWQRLATAEHNAGIFNQVE